MGKVDVMKNNGNNNQAYEGDGIEEVHVQPDGAQISKLVRNMK